MFSCKNITSERDSLYENCNTLLFEDNPVFSVPTGVQFHVIIISIFSKHQEGTVILL